MVTANKSFEKKNQGQQHCVRRYYYMMTTQVSNNKYKMTYKLKLGKC